MSLLGGGLGDGVTFFDVDHKVVNGAKMEVFVESVIKHYF